MLLLGALQMPQQQQANAACLCQVKTLAEVAGPNILSLQLAGAHLVHLKVFSRLKVLKLMYDAHSRAARQFAEEAGIASFCPPQLEVLQLDVSPKVSREHPPMLITGLSALTCSTEVYVHNALPADLPVSVTVLRVGLLTLDGLYAHHFPGQLAEFQGWVSKFQGHLSEAGLDMMLFGNDPAALGESACLREVCDLELAFSPDLLVSPSWPCGFFTQLQTLQLGFPEVSVPFCPVWDLSSCTALSSFEVWIRKGRPDLLCLAHITGVTADNFELHFRDGSMDSWPLFCFTSWTLSRVSIFCDWGHCMGLPGCVLACLGALQCCSAPPAITLNGFTPAAAAASCDIGAPAAWEAWVADTSDED